MISVIHPTIPDIILFEPAVHQDARGTFLESFRESWFQGVAEAPAFVQDCHSRSTKGVLRGLHLQKVNPQGKLVRVASGKVLDVAVDMRVSSQTYGRWVGEILSDENNRIMWIPEGFAHGFLVLSDSADFVYKCTTYHDPSSDTVIAYDSPGLCIDWSSKPITPIMSPKDEKGVVWYNGLGFDNDMRWVG